MDYIRTPGDRWAEKAAGGKRESLKSDPGYDTAEEGAAAPTAPAPPPTAQPLPDGEGL